MPDFRRLIQAGDFFLVKIGDKEYRGLAQEVLPGKAIKIKVTKPDQTLVSIMLESDIDVRFIADDGNLYSYTTPLLERKVPLITFGFPGNDIPGTTIRKHVRISTSFWASILDPASVPGANSNPIGDGTVVDMTVEGARLMAQMELQKGTPVCFEFIVNDNSPPVFCKGEIKNVKPGRYGTTYYGIQFTGMDKATLQNIAEILKNPTQ